jgi:hypothetical protein
MDYVYDFARDDGLHAAAAAADDTAAAAAPAVRGVLAMGRGTLGGTGLAGILGDTSGAVFAARATEGV